MGRTRKVVNLLTMSGPVVRYTGDLSRRMVSHTPYDSRLTGLKSSETGPSKDGSVPDIQEKRYNLSLQLVSLFYWKIETQRSFSRCATFPLGPGREYGGNRRTRLKSTKGFGLRLQRGGRHSGRT